MNDNGNNASIGDATTARTRDDSPLPSELPFLVTHWLRNYQGPEGGDEERKVAIKRLRNATTEMAAAFSSLGAYGTSSRVSDTRDGEF
jgi:hypothetical protein